MSPTKLYQGNTSDRILRLSKLGIISAEAANWLQSTQPTNWADHVNTWIENAIGYWPMPLGIANDIPINNQIYHLPLAIEETSVVAGLCKMGKLLRHQGHLTTEPLQSEIIGQVPFKDLVLDEAMRQDWHKQCPKWIDIANEKVVPGLYQRGGGVTQLSLHQKANFLVVHIHCDPCDAMGANLINQISEHLKPYFETFFKHSAITAILSNLNLPRVKAKINIKDLEPSHAERIMTASQWAHADSNRAATHNKGIFNGIDAMCIATGNDWRAVSANGHAYAVKDGHYRSLSTWSYEAGELVGELTLPMSIGTVGGLTKQHPIAQLSLDILNQPNAQTLSELIVACGLLQNLAALYALTDNGIVKGHMKLHLANLIQTLDLDQVDAERLKALCALKLEKDGFITQSNVKALLVEMSS